MISGSSGSRGSTISERNVDTEILGKKIKLRRRKNHRFTLTGLTIRDVELYSYGEKGCNKYFNKALVFLGGTTTHKERGWIMYDIADSPVSFASNIIFPMLIADFAGRTTWLTTTDISLLAINSIIKTVLTFFLYLTISSSAEYGRLKTKFLFVSAHLGSLMLILSLFAVDASTWGIVLVLILDIMSKVFYRVCSVAYDALLFQVTEGNPDRQHMVNSLAVLVGYLAMGVVGIFIGGATFGVSLLFWEQNDDPAKVSEESFLSMTFVRYRLFMALLGVWWIFFTREAFLLFGSLPYGMPYPPGLTVDFSMPRIDNDMSKSMASMNRDRSLTNTIPGFELPPSAFAPTPSATTTTMSGSSDGIELTEITVKDNEEKIETDEAGKVPDHGEGAVAGTKHGNCQDDATSEGKGAEEEEAEEEGDLVPESKDGEEANIEVGEEDPGAALEEDDATSEGKGAGEEEAEEEGDLVPESKDGEEANIEVGEEDPGAALEEEEEGNEEGDGEGEEETGAGAKGPAGEGEDGKERTSEGSGRSSSPTMLASAQSLYNMVAGTNFVGQEDEVLKDHSCLAIGKFAFVQGFVEVARTFFIIFHKGMKDLAGFMIALMMITDGMSSVTSNIVLVATKKWKLQTMWLAISVVCAGLSAVAGIFCFRKAIKRKMIRTFNVLKLNVIMMVVAILWMSFLEFPVLEGETVAVPNSTATKTLEPEKVKWTEDRVGHHLLLIFLGSVFMFNYVSFNAFMKSSICSLTPEHMQSSVFAICELTQKGASVFGPLLILFLSDNVENENQWKVVLWVSCGLLVCGTPFLFIVDEKRGHNLAEKIDHKRLALLKANARERIASDMDDDLDDLIDKNVATP
jgi:MFS-type transporter involved in bile tolerance (Atg22 family)|eukprot:g8150.t1